MTNDIMIFTDHHPYVALAIVFIIVVGLVAIVSEYWDRKYGENF